jgi:hypothetical protein
VRGTEDSHPEQQLDQPERHVPGDGMGGDQVRCPLNRAGDPVRLTGRRWGEHLCGEAACQHERLQLQRPVEEPEQPERDLQPASCDA